MNNQTPVSQGKKPRIVEETMATMIWKRKKNQNSDALARPEKMEYLLKQELTACVKVIVFGGCYGRFSTKFSAMMRREPR